MVFSEKKRTKLPTVALKSNFNKHVVNTRPETVTSKWNAAIGDISTVATVCLKGQNILLYNVSML